MYKQVLSLILVVTITGCDRSKPEVVQPNPSSAVPSKQEIAEAELREKKREFIERMEQIDRQSKEDERQIQITSLKRKECIVKSQLAEFKGLPPLDCSFSTEFKPVQH